MGKSKISLPVIIAIIALLSGVFGVANIIYDTWILIILTNYEYAPPPISGHTTVFNPVNNTLVVFGGETYGVALQNVTMYDLLDDAWLGSNYSMLPSARYEHAAVTTQNNQMYIFGGRNNTTVFNDIFCYDMVRNTWRQVATNKTAPTARYGHSGVLHSLTNELIFWGGKSDNGSILQQILKFNFDTEEWTVLNFDTPIATVYHSAAVSADNKMIIFGGINASSVYVNTTYFYDLPSNKWVSVSLNGTTYPMGLANHGAIVTPLNQMIVFGGRSSNTSASDQLWKYDILYNTWTYVPQNSDAPSARWGATCTSTLFNTMMVFGGKSSAKSYSNDIFKYDVVSPILRSSSDGVVLVVMLTIVCSMIIGLCFALDLMAEKNENERLERLELEEQAKNGAAQKKKAAALKKERQPLFETF